ncbi:hypothetical protein A3A60_02180 [Candidatus Curtissbacteria bacterium RIFCSPLOWO2_01_FULL_42_26]|uniref:Uncharacterized protein n=1 Tax=Candidatus Curtissbacteria bacterium RIFCSPLOWO2_01_FULL_42_26 TaxID=1797729 RepID=A0A1F5HYR9_9BACT|nr:MAG: hypothetical protein A3A60_02180 [Candidatus Curtissbacteria bacterium RIFCSPLOWO2_01_FULL_42_26]
MNSVKILWKKWLAVAKPIGNFNAQVILTVFYLVIVLPLGIGYRLLSDPLNMKREKISKQKTSFAKWKHPKQNLEEARKQY